MEIQNVEIQKIFRSTKSKEGKDFISSKGNPFTKVDIYIDKEAVDDPAFEGKMTYFEYYDTTNSWDIGTRIAGTIEKNIVGDKTYFNFKLPPSTKKRTELQVADHEERIEKLEEVVFYKREEEPKKKERVLEFPKKTGGTKPEAPEVEDEDIDEDDSLPF